MIRIPTALAALLTAAPLPATAQITAEDVWDNTGLYVRAFGGTHGGTLTREGDVVTVSGDRAAWALPLGAGDLVYSLSDYTLTEGADGTVTITYPTPVRLRLDLRLSDGSAGFAVLLVEGEDIVTEASGTPGAVSYATRTGPLTVSLEELRVPDDAWGNVTFTAEVESTETQTRILDDSLTVVYSASDIGRVTTSSLFETGDGFESVSTAEYAPARSVLNMGLIPGGASILDLSGALRDGMYLTAETSAQGSESVSRSTFDGQVIEETTVSAGRSEADIRFDRDGLAFDATGEALLVDFAYGDEFFGRFASGFGIARLSNSMTLPLLAEPDPQDLRYALTLEDLRLGPAIWALFDPEKALDRSPFQLSLDLAGSVVNEVEWLDILSLEGLQFENEFPVRLIELSARDVLLSALGARLAADAAFTFDNDDTTTYPGFPRPTGEAGFSLAGLDAVLDHFAGSGAIPGDALFGLRMGLGMVTVPGEAPDSRTGRVEFTPDGRIVANGQRLR